jgi:hypothetical protein
MSVHTEELHMQTKKFHIPSFSLQVILEIALRCEIIEVQHTRLRKIKKKHLNFHADLQLLCLCLLIQQQKRCQRKFSLFCIAAGYSQ